MHTDTFEFVQYTLMMTVDSWNPMPGIYTPPKKLSKISPEKFVGKGSDKPFLVEMPPFLGEIH